MRSPWAQCMLRGRIGVQRTAAACCPIRQHVSMAGRVLTEDQKRRKREQERQRRQEKKDEIKKKDRERKKRHYDALSEEEKKRKNEMDRKRREKNKFDINAKDRERKKRKAAAMTAEEKREHNAKAARRMRDRGRAAVPSEEHDSILERRRNVPRHATTAEETTSDGKENSNQDSTGELHRRGKAGGARGQ